MASTIKGTILLNNESGSSTKNTFYPKTTLDQIEGLSLTNGKIDNVNTANKAATADYATYDIDEKNNSFSTPIHQKYAKAIDVRNSSIRNIRINDDNEIELKDFNGNIICTSDPITANSKLIVGSSNTSTQNSNATNNIYVNLTSNNTVKNAINIKGTGGTTIKATTNSGKSTITIDSKEYEPATKTNLGLVKVDNDNSNLTINDDGMLHLTADNISDALGYIPLNESDLASKDIIQYLN